MVTFFIAAGMLLMAALQLPPLYLRRDWKAFFTFLFFWLVATVYILLFHLGIDIPRVYPLLDRLIPESLRFFP